MTRADEDGYFTPADAAGVGAVAQLTEFDGWTEAEMEEHRARMARRRPLGFLPWPEDT